MVMQDKSEYEKSIRNYMKKDGLTREEAAKKAGLDIVQQAGLDGLAGAIQGGGMAAGGSAIGHLNVASAGRQIIATPNGIETLLSAAKQGDPTVKRAANAVVKNPSPGNVGNLALALQEYTKHPVGDVLSYPSQVKAMHDGKFTPPANTGNNINIGKLGNTATPLALSLIHI